MARQAWNKAREAISSGRYKTVVLDEFTYLLSYNMIDREEALEVLRAKPADLHICVTGRDAIPKLVDLADLVSEIQPVKHPYKEGIKAQKGIEF